MKHLIFIGKPRTGKSLFAQLIFGREKSLFLHGVDCNPNDPFLFDNGKEEWNYENIVIDDPRSKKFSVEPFFLHCCHREMLVRRRFRKTLAVKTPRFIFILDKERVQLLDFGASFNRRFEMIDFDKNTIADLTKLIEDEKIIINTAL